MPHTRELDRVRAEIALLRDGAEEAWTLPKDRLPTPINPGLRRKDKS